jgi:hypothetical protein
VERLGDRKIRRHGESIREQGESAGDTAGLRDMKTGRQEESIGDQGEGRRQENQETGGENCGTERAEEILQG